MARWSAAPPRSPGSSRCRRAARSSRFGATRPRCALSSSAKDFFPLGQRRGVLRVGEEARARPSSASGAPRGAFRSARTRSVSFFVSSLLASTSGWSNGLMPRSEPATAVAISQRNNSCAEARAVLDARCAPPGDRPSRAPPPRRPAPRPASTRAAGRRTRGPRRRRRRPERLAVHRDEAFAVLARGLGDELLEPGAEVVNRRRGDQRHLVPPLRAAKTRAPPPGRRPGSRAAWTLGPHACTIASARAGTSHVEPHHRRGHEPEVGQRRIAPADARARREDVAEAIALGHRSSLLPGSVMAMKCLPAFSLPTVFSIRSKKY